MEGYMENTNSPKCSHNSEQRQNEQSQEETTDQQGSSQSPTNSCPRASKSFSFASSLTQPDCHYINKLPQCSVPLIIRPSYQTPTVCQPPSNLQTPNSMAGPVLKPASLFLQALSKLSENSLNLPTICHKRLLFSNFDKIMQRVQPAELSPPDSITSAPPSYSFVLRQMRTRRRPRLMGTFIPSPSFVQQTPPPTYATAFDIYMDNPMPPTPQRLTNFGYTSVLAICPECGYTGMTVITSRITLCTHMCAFIFCIFCCWICVPLPYLLRSCKDVYHHCSNCRYLLGMYCPTNPDAAFA